ncbi:hypothetical protein OLH03_10165, partial [Streptococcus pneumoniae]|nr:hypothetical protein [Streptococcus pneumoniae]MDG9600504.1 hypothetical protein [Streptococcus pneumoniae]MDG9606410.1 hypothetical protein [Streptococcus pneumoniae]
RFFLSNFWGAVHIHRGFTHYKYYRAEIDNATTESIKGVVADLKSAVIKGDTVYFFKVDGKIYKVKASVSDDLPYLENGRTFEGQVGKDSYLKTFKVQ